MNEPVDRFALKHKAIYWLIIAAAYVGIWFYAGWRVVLFMVVFGIVVGPIGYTWGRRAAH